MAVCGLPEPRKDHAGRFSDIGFRLVSIYSFGPSKLSCCKVVMARFATDCMYRMQMLVKALEVNLGPDTSDLGLRIGEHFWFDINPLF